MADLFDVLPTTLFKPLAAPGAPVYGRVLLRLLFETQRQFQPLSRDTAMQIVAEIVSAPDAMSLTDDAVEEGSEQISHADDAVQARAGAILRYLARCGWISNEHQSDYSQAYVLPDFAFRLLRVLSEIATNDPPSLRGLICVIHDLLRAAVEDGDAHIRLPEAHRQTMHLLNGLVELQQSIGTHIAQVLQQNEARSVLEQLFLNYREEVVDRAYHQLRTTDHVSRYRPGVLDALAQLASDNRLEADGRRLFELKDAPTMELAVGRLLEQMAAIRDQFDALDRRIEAIDTRHSQFVDSAVRNVELRLTASSTTSGQLHTILTHLLTAETMQAGKALPEPETLIDLFELTLLDSQSLAAPTRAAVPFVPETTAAPRLSSEQRSAAIAATRSQLQRVISRSRVRQFAMGLLGDRETIRGDEIPLAGPEELPLLIYLRTYGDGTLGYTIHEFPDGGWIERDGVGFRNFVLQRVADNK